MTALKVKQIGGFQVDSSEACLSKATFSYCSLTGYALNH